ncbi:lysogeny maintenance protein PflM, partial [Pseudomonas aeruginosa]
LCRPRSFCAKHDPSRRPPKYWHVVYDSGKPTPFVPVREAFQLEG